MRLRRALCLLLLAAVVRAQPQALGFQTIVVQPGDTLWGIAQKYLKDPKRWNEILTYNTLPTRDPTVALPGMTLRVPVELVKESLRAAKLIEMKNEVLHRKRETADWDPAREQMDLFPEDGVRTTARAEAKVRFAEGQLLDITQNSMVILSPPRKDSDLRLLQGEVQGKGKARVLTATALVVPKTEDSVFRATIKDDLSTLVQVYAGRASVEAQGRTVEVKAGFASRVPLDKPPSAPIALPEMANLDLGEPLSDKNMPQMVLKGTTLSMRMPTAASSGASGATAARGESGRPAARAGSDELDEKEAKMAAGNAAREKSAEDSAKLAIAVGTPISGFRVQVAWDAGFSRIAFDRTFDVNSTVDLSKFPGIPSGNLFYRVALIDLLGLEGQNSPPRPLYRP